MTSQALLSLMTGRILPLGPRGVPSGIVKRPVSGPSNLTVTGFDNDAQGDLVRHGGPEKAVHHYPYEHYVGWKSEIDGNSLLDHPGAFGESFSTVGMTEENVAIGDVFEIGSAVLEVSQGRQPCWKLNERFGNLTMSRFFQSSGRTGWYYRIRKPGIVSPDDWLTLVERSSPDWTIRRVWRTFYVDTLDRSELERISKIPALAEGWRNHAIKRLQTNEVEDWTERLDGRLPD